MVFGSIKRKARNFLGALISPFPGEESAHEQRHGLVGPPALWRRKRAFQVRFLKEHGLKPHHALLDLGCGTLRGGIPLIEYLDKAHYYGLEVRAQVLEEGRRELAESRLGYKEPVLLHSPDLSAIALEKQFDYIWAFSVLVHMEDSILDGALEFVARHLGPDGVFYANAGLGDAPERRWQGFPVVRRSLAFYQDACTRHGLACEDIGTLSSFAKGGAQQQKGFQHMLKMTRKRQITAA